MSEIQQRVFSGVQPTGNLHLGNYLGAIRNFVKMQEDYNCIYCVVDLHAITVAQDPNIMMPNIHEVTAAFLAAGINPEKHIIFQQSAVAGHSQLAWVFNCVARMGWLNRMTQFKEKAGKNKENASVGLFSYPNLMAADILLYRATHVPVGEDQKQHLELTRDIAQKFNIDFADRIKEFGHGDIYFPLTEPVITGGATRVMSLRDGSKKMSKSDISEYSRITMRDDADMIAKKIKKAKTDPLPVPASKDEYADRPEAKNLIGIYAALSEQSEEEIFKDFGGKEFSAFKKALTDVAIEKLSPITSEMLRFMQDKAEINRILNNGAERANSIAEQTMKEVYQIFGLRT